MHAYLQNLTLRRWSFMQQMFLVLWLKKVISKSMYGLVSYNPFLMYLVVKGAGV